LPNDIAGLSGKQSCLLMNVVSIGPWQTFEFALHMSAFDPKRTFVGGPGGYDYERLEELVAFLAQ